ncbi:MAG: hypothetical protein R3A52_10845 [Polyangiales bacterium]
MTSRSTLGAPLRASRLPRNSTAECQVPPDAPPLERTKPSTTSGTPSGRRSTV